ncbi:MAG: hypothetical protein KDD43_10470, partial [Bdellovibrionales bacterium]|nr:hypothetical protein [Bdellovibrionales bacterium]
MKTKVIYPLKGIGLAALLFSCSDVRLVPPQYEDLVSQADFVISSSICPQTDLKPAKNTKFVFMIDMSVSNIGGWDHRTGPEGQRMSYWDPSKNSDIDGLRFDYIKEFLNGCGAQQGNEFAIMGMSHTAGTIVQSGNKKSLSCNSEFGSSSSASSVVDSFKQAQREERPWYEQWTEHYLTSSDWPGSLGATSYNSALSCSENLIAEELTSDRHIGTDYYHLFMISDGTPNDGYSKGCNRLPEAERRECYLSGIEDYTSYLMQLGIAKNKTMRIHGISYGPNPSAQSEFLNTIARYGNTGKAIELSNVADFPEALCRAVASQAAVDYQADFVMAINLSTLRRNNKLVADSDMDGLSDEEETAKGFDPKVARSSAANGVLDGICARLGGPDLCRHKRDKITCDPSVVNSTGLSECDIKILGLDKVSQGPSQGLDSDGDGMPDLVEILKGTDPGFADMSEDPDGDGMATRAEILAGTDPFGKEGPLNLAETSRIHTEYAGQVEGDPDCNFGAWQMRLEHIPVAPNLEI